MPPVPVPPARRILESYEPGFRAGMRIASQDADDPAAVAIAVANLPAAACGLLDLLLLTVAGGDPVPDRFREAIAINGLALWQTAVLLPRASSYGEATLHPLHYAGSCRLNPATQGLRPAWLKRRSDAQATFAPADARWDAVVVAALMEANPGQLTQDGILRKDVERRLVADLGADDDRWTLALRLARLTGLIRPAASRLHGFPEATPRPLADPAGLLSEPATGSILLRLIDEEWLDVPVLLASLRDNCREILYSPAQNAYSGRSIVFDDAGWEIVERPSFLAALDAFQRCGVVDLARDASGITAVRRPGARPNLAPGCLLSPDGDILVHVGELPLQTYGRLARIAPFLDGENLRRHRLTREGAAADIAAGHRDTLEFLAACSRTGLPTNIAEMVREWQRSATRITVMSGVDVIEDPDGRLRLGDAPAHARVIDYTKPPRMKFIAFDDKLLVLDGWDALPVRAALSRVARDIGRISEGRAYLPELRPHTEPAALLNRLRMLHGGDLPGELETLILAGSGLGPVTAEDAIILHLPHAAAAALRRDRVAGQLLRRIIGPDESVVARSDLPKLRERLAELGIEWSGVA